jgi:hypothetical protein
MMAGLQRYNQIKTHAEHRFQSTAIQRLADRTYAARLFTLFTLQNGRQHDRPHGNGAMHSHVTGRCMHI